MKKSTLRIGSLFLFMFLGTFVFGQTKYDVTLTVNMTDAETFNPATDEVFISGSFAGWAQPGTDANYKMTPTEADPMIYSITVSVDSGQIQYKYFRVIEGAASWDNGEWTGDPNRMLIIFLNGLTFNDIWGDKPYWVTFNVDMTPADPFNPTTDKVCVTGSFDGWLTPGTLPELTLAPVSEGSMIYTVSVLIYPESYQFKYFLVLDNTPSWDNGEWAGDPNRVFTVDSTDLVMDDVWADINAGIFDVKTKHNFDIYPNPVVNSLNIGNIEDVNKIEIIDVTGKTVYSTEVNAPSISINTSNLSKGIYIVSFQNNKGVQTSKFVKN